MEINGAKRSTVDIRIDVTGITIDNLWDELVAAPIGPIHLHRYASHDHCTYDSAELAFPAPFGPNYTATPIGFCARMRRRRYATGAAASLEQGRVVLNIHTDKFNNGSGEVVPVDGAPIHRCWANGQLLDAYLEGGFSNFVRKAVC